MQWKHVYAVAKHGNAVKPGGLFVYKDEKFSSHIQTYDMSQVVEVEPRAQEYKPGIKWEFRMLVKRDDVIFATDEIPERTAWIDALTAIMGKVSMASHSELQSRVADADQINRELQTRMAEMEHTNRELHDAVERLQAENEELEDQITHLQKESLRMREEHHARQKDMVSDLDDMQQTMDTRCELLEREVSVWRAKANSLEKELQEIRQKQQIDETEELKKELAELKAAAAAPRTEQQQQFDTFDASGGGGSNSNLKDIMTNVKYNLQALRDHMRVDSNNGPLLQSHILDIKSGVHRLTDIFEETRRGWSDLQSEVVKCLQQQTKNTGTIKQLENGISNLSSTEGQVPSDSQLNVVIQMLELLQLSQTRLMEGFMEQSDTEIKGAHVDKARMESIQGMFEDIQSKVNSQGLSEDMVLKLMECTEDVKQIIGEAHEASTAKMVEILEQMQVEQKQSKLTAQILEHMQTEHAGNNARLTEILEQIMALQRQHSEEQKHHLFNKSMKDEGNDSSISGNDHSLVSEEVHQLVEGTQEFIERTLLVLDRYNNAGVEETVRRAVKSAFNSYLGANWQEETMKDNEEKLKRYEENARGYIEKMMSGMQEHTVECLGEMYRMIDDLIKMAVGRLEGHINQEQDDNGRLNNLGQLVELYGKLTSAREVLESEIERFQEERTSLVHQISDLKKSSADVERELQENKAALQSVKAEYELVQNNLHRAQQDRLTKELEPLIQQITRLKQLATFGSSNSSNSSTASDEDESISSPSGYVDLGHLSQPSTSTQSGVNSRSRPTSPLPAGSGYNSSNRTNLDTPTSKGFGDRRASFDRSSGSGFSETNWKTSSRFQHDSRTKNGLAGMRPPGASALSGFRGRQ
ncbi:hypothetical protein BX666DRAFT_1093780 [Dichotomocladium elegans]|nr:hypothetical protein BX666DRAFT_1093780 [Dichotomocladium elegans]